MSKYLTVQVTEDDIRFGVRGGSYTGCAIARAISRITGRKAGVCCNDIRVWGGEEKDKVYELSKKAHKYYKKFDRWGNVKPTTFRFKLKPGTT